MEEGGQPVAGPPAPSPSVIVVVVMVMMVAMSTRQELPNDRRNAPVSIVMVVMMAVEVLRDLRIFGRPSIQRLQHARGVGDRVEQLRI